MAQDQGLYAHITTNATTTLNSRPTGGILKRIAVNTAGTAWTATIYDSTTGSGNVIAVVTATSIFDLEYNAQYSIGLTVVTAGTTPGDITVVYT